jgi:hypothetical protein
VGSTRHGDCILTVIVIISIMHHMREVGNTRHGDYIVTVIVIIIIIHHMRATPCLSHGGPQASHHSAGRVLIPDKIVTLGKGSSLYLHTRTHRLPKFMVKFFIFSINPAFSVPSLLTWMLYSSMAAVRAAQGSSAVVGQGALDAHPASAKITAPTATATHRRTAIAIARSDSLARAEGSVSGVRHDGGVGLWSYWGRKGLWGGRIWDEGQGVSERWDKMQVPLTCQPRRGRTAKGHER